MIGSWSVPVLSVKGGSPWGNGRWGGVEMGDGG